MSIKKIFCFLGLVLIVAIAIPKKEIRAETINTGWYTMQAKANVAFRIGTTKDNLTLQKAGNLSDQKFKLTKLSEGVYKIGTGRSAGALSLKSGIKQAAYDGTKSMRWKLEYDASGKCYYIKNIGSGKYLTYSSLKDNANFLEATKKTDNTQKFTLTKHTPGFTVTFKSAGKSIKRQAVKTGGSATAPNPVRAGYKFIGWDKAYNKITSSITINAKWQKLVSFKDLNPDVNYVDKLKDKTLANFILGKMKAGEDIEIKNTVDKDKLKETLEAIRKTYCKYSGTPFAIRRMDSSVTVYKGDVAKDSLERSTYIRNQIKKIANELFPKNITEEEAVKIIDNYFRDNYTYKGGNALYSMLKEKKGNCEGYASFAQVLCDYIGIDCKYVAGNAGGNHVWNRINVNDKWYYVDFTWNKNNNYYLTENLWKDHEVRTEKYMFR